MSKSLQDMSVREVARLLAPFVGFLAVGIVTRLLYPETWPAHHFVELLSDAVAIAGALGIGVDLFVAKRLIDHTADSLAHRLVGYGLPSKLQGEIRKIVETTAVRTDVRQEYRLTRRPDGFLDVEIRFSHDVRNYGQAPIQYSPLLAEDDYYQPAFEHLEYGITGEAGHSFSGAALQALVTERFDHTLEIKGPHPVVIPPWPASDASGGSTGLVCRVSWRYRVRMPDNYVHSLGFAGPAMEVRVGFDSVPDDITFVGDDRYASRNGNTWTYSKPFLAGQHLRVKWFPKS